MSDTCPACLATVSRLLSSQKWTFAGERYCLVECEGCGSARTCPLPDDGVLKRLYETSFDYRWYRDHFPAKLEDSRIRLVEYKDLLGERVLDFGGGLGYFSQVAREAGYQSTTYDPFAANKPAAVSSTQWDTVVVLHVLEHTNDLDRLCREIRKLVLPGGRLILAVPNYSSRGYRKLGMQWVWAQPPLIHVHHLTAAGVTALLARHGFTDIRISYHDRWDANVDCDVDHAKLSRLFDAAWGLRPLGTFAGYRRLVAAVNSWRRFRGLAKTRGKDDPNNTGLSELQVTARVADVSCESR